MKRPRPATKKQCELIDELQNRGASIPENDHGNPSDEMYESVESADQYIKQWGHLMSKNATSMRTDEFGGVLNT